MMKNRWILLAAIALCSFQCLTAQDLTERLLDRIEDCIQHESALENKEELMAVAKALRSEHAYIEAGSDAMRTKFVGMQQITEHVLACAQAMEDIVDLVGVIHTPTPATPLCIRPNEAPSEGLLDASVANDPQRLLTVQARAQTVREYLHKGGSLYIAYPRGGLAKRSPEQQAVYSEALNQFASHLFDWVLACDYLPSDRVGAFYLFKDSQGNVHAFSIKSTQAISPEAQSEWGIWFGGLSDAVVRERIGDIHEYLLALDGPDMREYLDL